MRKFLVAALIIAGLGGAVVAYGYWITPCCGPPQPVIPVEPPR